MNHYRCYFLYEGRPSCVNVFAETMPQAIANAKSNVPGELISCDLVGEVQNDN